MRPARTICLLLALLGLLVLPAAAGAAAKPCVGASATPTAANLAKVRTTVLCLVNRERTRRGLHRLRRNADLEMAAQRHSADMLAEHYFDHVSPQGSTPLQRVTAAGYLRGAGSWVVGENLAWGQSERATPREIVRAWMASPDHRANILRPAYRHMGIGVSPGAPVGSGPGGTYTTEFGKRA